MENFYWSKELTKQCFFPGKRNMLLHDQSTAHWLSQSCKKLEELSLSTRISFNGGIKLDINLQESPLTTTGPSITGQSQFVICAILLFIG
jgi:hypothetical protein